MLSSLLLVKLCQRCHHFVNECVLIEDVISEYGSVVEALTMSKFSADSVV